MVTEIHDRSSFVIGCDSNAPSHPSNPPPTTCALSLSSAQPRRRRATPHTTMLPSSPPQRSKRFSYERTIVLVHWRSVLERPPRVLSWYLHGIWRHLIVIFYYSARSICILIYSYTFIYIHMCTFICIHPFISHSIHLITTATDRTRQCGGSVLHVRVHRTSQRRHFDAQVRDSQTIKTFFFFFLFSFFSFLFSLSSSFFFFHVWTCPLHALLKISYLTLTFFLNIP